jgi:hypothetical protein
MSFGTNQFASRRYKNTVSNITSSAYVNIGNVTGDNLAAGIRMTVHGTSNNVVINSTIEILVNHSQDIVIQSFSGLYVPITVKITSDNDANFDIAIKTTNAVPNPTTVYVELFPLNSETFIFTTTPAYSSTVLEHPCSPGYNISSTGGTTYYNINNGNVGIGTTTPAQKLEIQGNGAVLRLSTASSPATYYFDIQSNYDSADTINFYGTAGNNLLKYIYNTNALSLQPAGGNVGIGTTTPSVGKLQINTGAASNNAITIQASSQTSITYGIGIDASSNFAIYDNFAASQRVTINGSGNVGIGVTSPTGKLQIDSNNTPTLSGTSPTGAIVIKSTATTALTFGVYENSPFYGWLQMRHGSVADIAYPLSLQPLGGGISVGSTASPSYTLDVNGSIGGSSLYISNTNGIYLNGDAGGLVVNGTGYFYANSTGGSYFQNTVRFRSDIRDDSHTYLTINGGTSNHTYFYGRVGIGDASPACQLQIGNNVSAGGFSNFTDYQILLYKAATATTSYGIGIESSTLMFHSDDQYKFYVDNVAKVLISSTGTLTAAGDLVAYGSPSDITLKTNIKPLTGSLDKVIKLQGVSFTWKEDTEISKMTGIKDDIGFIAQEVKEILPELVRENENGLLSLRDKSITALLVEAIKEQQKQIDELKYLLQSK